MRRKTIVSLVLLATLPVTAAHAYIGPGAGAGTIAVVLGILSSIFLAFVGIVWYPIKRLLRKLKGGAKPSVTGQPGAAGGVTRTDSGPAPSASAIGDDDDEPVTQ
jgi:hypothetical protein